ncbi:uncharacterized protein LOC142338565 [Convolutriloba macropyga]|uniref:uncharacterized protein LOC142338565 n=1 Tax=Convolutriloba macropyga TaxID=536237 RepID=UPI003F5203F5
MNAHAGEFSTQSEIVPQEISSQIFHKKSDSNSQFYQQGLEITVPATANSTLNSNPITSPHCVYPALPIPPPPYQIQSGISGGGGGGGVSNSSSTAPLLGKCAMVKSNTTDSTLSNLSISSINQPQPRQSFDVALLDNNMTSSLPRLGLISSQQSHTHPNSFNASSITTHQPIMHSENHYCRDSIVKLNPSVLQTEKSSSRIKSNANSSSRISVKNLTILTLIAASLFAMTLAFLLTLWFCLEYFECETKGSCGNSHGPLKFKQN